MLTSALLRWNGASNNIKQLILFFVIELSGGHCTEMIILRSLLTTFKASNKFLESISSTFYAQIFCTYVVLAAYKYVERAAETTFVQKICM